MQAPKDKRSLIGCVGVERQTMEERRNLLSKNNHVTLVAL